MPTVKVPPAYRSKLEAAMNKSSAEKQNAAEQNSAYEEKSSDGVWNTAKQVVSRLGVHAVCILLAVMAANLSGGDGSPGFITLFFSSYIALICLWARPRTGYGDADWLVPCGSGLIQTLVAGFLGASWPFALLTGGLQTWFGRLLIYRKKFLWEWTVLPFVLIAFILWTFSSGSMGLSLSVPAGFAVIAAVAFSFHGIHSKLQRAVLKKAGYLKLVARLKELSISKYFSMSLRGAVSGLTVRIDKYLDLARQKGIDDRFVELASKAAVGLEAYERELKDSSVPAAFLFIKRSEDPEEALRSQEELKVLENINDLNRYLDSAIASPVRASGSDSFDEYLIKAQSILHKSSMLPEQFAPMLEQIAAATESMVGKMRSDPNDVSSGSMFLKRYLNSTDSLIDEYLRLKDQNAESEDLKKAFSRTEEVLDRISKAFKGENEFMLQNDTINFTAELNALDTFIKSRGHF